MKRVTYFLIFSAISFSYSFSQNYQWSELPNSPVPIGGVQRFEDIFFIDPNTGWIVDFTGPTHKTTNGGDNWTRFNNILYNRCIGFFDSHTGLIGTLDPVRPLFKTTNGGINYFQITNLPVPNPIGFCGISIVSQNVAYCCGTYFGNARIIKTTDQGGTWSDIFSDTSMARTLVDCHFWTIDSGIAVGGYNTSSYEFGKSVIIKTTNGGNSWHRVYTSGRTNEWCWKISFISRNTGFISIQRHNGLAYILKTTNNGDNWSEIPFMVYDEEGIGFINENTGWVGGWTGPTYQTTNGGANWQLAGWGTNVNRFRFINDTLAYAVGERVYKYSKGPVGINLISTEIPQSYKLYQNYPNPFNPVTKIKFDITRDERRETRDVKLVVYDALGREVRRLVNEKLSAGMYEIEFNGNNLPSGIYFYIIETENFRQTRKMLLQK